MIVLMARWRAEAFERLPELRGVITSADNVMALWIELQYAFEKAYQAEAPDDSLIARIYSFADWCEQAPRGPDASHDAPTAVTVAFYEHIPTSARAREDMPRWFRYADVANHPKVFGYLIGDEDYRALLKHMAQNQNRYQARGVGGRAAR
jgi:hypothetical protein